MEVKCNRLDRGFQIYQKEFEQKALDVLRSGWYVLGHELDSFENEFAQYVGSSFCAGVASGLDALRIAVYLLGIQNGDGIWTGIFQFGKKLKNGEIVVDL